MRPGYASSRNRALAPRSTNSGTKSGMGASFELRAGLAHGLRDLVRRLTNKPIVERLVLSPRTVSTHLYQLFPKVGITARATLRDVLDNLPTNPGWPAPDSRQAFSTSRRDSEVPLPVFR